ncbi:MAG: hypothetical protein VB086_13830 [Clostridiaceae bacterium]|nr:hypothetical protein [Clostridiaceae bacterium]
MELLLQELKKIWRPAILAVIILLGAIYYYLFPEFYIQYFNNGDSAEASFSLSAEWAEKYGSTLEADERAELDAQLAAEQTRFAEELKAYDEPAEYGFSDWESFDAFQQAYYKQASENDGETDMVTEEVIWKMIRGTNYFTVDTLISVMKFYDNLADDIPPNLNYVGSGDSAATYEKTIARVAVIKTSDRVHGYLPFGMLDSTNSYLKYLAVWAVLSVVLLLSPTLVRDRIRHMRAAQWSSKTGRRVLNIQFAAAGISALALTLVNLVIYAIPFLLQHPLIFKNFQLFSFQIFWIPWFDWTYGQYLIVMALMIVVLAIAAGGLTVFLSQYSGNYVAMLLKALPLFAALAYISSSWIMDQAFFAGNALSKALAMPRAEFLSAAALAALGIGLRLIACHKQLHREL